VGRKRLVISLTQKRERELNLRGKREGGGSPLGGEGLGLPYIDQGGKRGPFTPGVGGMPLILDLTITVRFFTLKSLLRGRHTKKEEPREGGAFLFLKGGVYVEGEGGRLVTAERAVRPAAGRGNIPACASN